MKVPFSTTQLQNSDSCANLIKENCLGKEIAVLSKPGHLGQNLYIGKLKEVQQLAATPQQPCYQLLIEPVKLIQHMDQVGRISNFENEKIPARVALYDKLEKIAVTEPDPEPEKEKSWWERLGCSVM